jgi:hypothetical protein
MGSVQRAGFVAVASFMLIACGGGGGGGGDDRSGVANITFVAKGDNPLGEARGEARSICAVSDVSGVRVEAQRTRYITVPNPNYREGSVLSMESQKSIRQDAGLETFETFTFGCDDLLG